MTSGDQSTRGNLMKKITVLAALLAIAGVSTTAQAYQMEGKLSVDRVSYDGEGAEDSTDFVVEGKYYLNPVANISSQPLAEDAFLQRASNVGLVYTRSDEGDSNRTAINGEYFFPGMPYYASAAVGRASGNNDGTTYELRGGYLPMPGLLLTVGITDTGDSTDPVLGAKYVGNLGMTNMVHLGARLGLGDEDSVLLEGDYFLDRTLSVGAAYQDIGSADLFTLRAEKFLTPEMAVGARFRTADDVNSFGVTGRLRF